MTSIRDTTTDVHNFSDTASIEYFITDTQLDFLPWENSDPLVSAHAREVALLYITCVLQQILLMLGIPGSALCIIVFLKQGLRDKVNVVLFSLAVSDLIYDVCQYLIKCNCYISLWDTVASKNWITATMANALYYSLCACVVSGALIAIMSFDRCLSVAIPLKANQVFSRRHMVIGVVLIYLVNIAFYMPNFTLYTILWKHDPVTNRSMAFLIPRDFYAGDNPLPRLIAIFYNVVVKPVSVFTTVVCTAVTIIKLRHAKKVRVQMSESQSQLSQSETRITKMLVFVSCVYVICVVPDLVAGFVIYFVPEFFLYKKYHNVFTVFYEVIFLATILNSSINFYVYVALSSKFRATCQGLVPCLSKCPRPLKARGRNKMCRARDSSKCSQITSTIST